MSNWDLGFGRGGRQLRTTSRPTRPIPSRTSAMTSSPGHPWRPRPGRSLPAVRAAARRAVGGTMAGRSARGARRQPGAGPGLGAGLATLADPGGGSRAGRRRRRHARAAQQRPPERPGRGRPGQANDAGRPPAPSRHASTGPRHRGKRLPPLPPLTLAAAEGVLATYTALNNGANAERSDSELAMVETGGSYAIDAGLYTIQRAADETPYPAFGPVAATYYIPRAEPADGPRWFVVRVANAFSAARRRSRQPSTCCSPSPRPAAPGGTRSSPTCCRARTPRRSRSAATGSRRRSASPRPRWPPPPASSRG